MMKGFIVKVSEVKAEAFGTVSRWFLISPKVGNSKYQRLAYLEGQNWGVSLLRELFTRGR